MLSSHMKSLIVAAANTTALSERGSIMVRPVLASSGDPYNEFAPGLKSQTEGTVAKNFATEQQFDHCTQPGDSY